MYLPTYTITNLILDYIVRYELSIRTITSTPLPYKYKLELYEKNRSEDLQALGEIIGSQIGYNKALEIQQGKEIISDRSKYKVFSNYRSTQEFIKTYNHIQFLAPSIQLMVHLNKLAMGGIIDEWELGRLKGFSEKPNELFDTWYKYRDFYPDLNVSKHFDDVMDWIVNPKAKIHKLIQFAVLLYEIIDKAPFFAGNQITGIVTVASLMKDYGYNPDNLLPLAKAINYIGPDFSESFKIAKSNKDMTMFIEVFLYSLSLEVLNVENQFLNTFENRVKKSSQLTAMFNSRQVKLLEYLEINKRISRQTFAKMMGTSFMTAFRDIQELMEKGYLKQGGVGRGTFYMLNEVADTDSEKKPLKVFIDASTNE